MTLGLLEYIPPDPTASFVIPDSICPGGIASISNNSDFGCQNSLNPNYQPDICDYLILLYGEIVQLIHIFQVKMCMKIKILYLKRTQIFIIVQKYIELLL